MIINYVLMVDWGFWTYCSSFATKPWAGEFFFFTIPIWTWSCKWNFLFYYL